MGSGLLNRWDIISPTAMSVRVLAPVSKTQEAQTYIDAIQANAGRLEPTSNTIQHVYQWKKFFNALVTQTFVFGSPA